MHVLTYLGFCHSTNEINIFIHINFIFYVTENATSYIALF